ncbi:sin3-associated polypeptide sap18 [Ophiostoma piceae UAMH 11346]|uniref:Sin3-associated polypeptide sap18 n=1 Tax=Ophiostoma piceae (strain UAMH 11346) TaxID=1262450 RepID=S3D8U2_OPHP1|nr:sin3-associated polypeptide sap18 [Ophiostoma piceae UAMH 11346]
MRVGPSKDSSTLTWISLDKSKKRWPSRITQDLCHCVEDERFQQKEQNKTRHNNGAETDPDTRMAAGPFLVKLYYRTGAFHRTDEFSTAHQLPFVAAHTFLTCSLAELSYFLAASQDPAVLPNTAVGTRIAFRLVHVNDDDAKDDSNMVSGSIGLPRITIKDIGSVVIGGGGPGAPTGTSSLEALDDYSIEGLDFDAQPEWGTADVEANTGRGYDDAEYGARSSQRSDTKTLADVHFVPGDCISCAIMPPLASGCAVPAGDIRSGRGSGIGEASIASKRPPPPPRKRSEGAGSRYYPESDYRIGKRGRNDRGGGPPYAAAVPTGEWRRGDALPDTGVWVRDGGRSGAPGNNDGGATGWPGSRRRRRNGR